MNRFRIAACLAFVVVVMTVPGAKALADQPGDAMTEDPATIDDAFPPAMRELSFPSAGATLNALLYLANGPGPHPTVVLLHGYPGNEKNLDLAQALRRAGWNVLFFHYRGAWGSGGDFSFYNALDDVAAALVFLRGAGDEFRVDKERIVLVGHSMGGFMAIAGGARDGQVKCIVGIAAADLAVIGDVFAADPEAARGFSDGTDKMIMLHGFSGAVALRELEQMREVSRLTGLGPALRGRKLLVIAGKRDQAVPMSVHDGLVAAFSAVEGLQFDTRVLDADHAFSWHRIALARAVTGWLDGNCR